MVPQGIIPANMTLYYAVEFCSITGRFEAILFALFKFWSLSLSWIKQLKQDNEGDKQRMLYGTKKVKSILFTNWY